MLAGLDELPPAEHTLAAVRQSLGLYLDARYPHDLCCFGMSAVTAFYDALRVADETLLHVPWHRCSDAGFIPLRFKAGKLHGLLTRKNRRIDKNALRKILAEVVPTAFWKNPQFVPNSDIVFASIFDQLHQQMDLEHTFRSESHWRSRALSAPEGVDADDRNKLLTDLLDGDAGKARRSWWLTKKAMMTGSTEFCIEVLRGILRCADDEELLLEYLEGIMGLAQSVRPPFLALLRLRDIFMRYTRPKRDPTTGAWQEEHRVTENRRALLDDCAALLAGARLQRYTPLRQLAHVVSDRSVLWGFGYSRLVIDSLREVMKLKKHVQLTWVKGGHRDPDINAARAPRLKQLRRRLIRLDTAGRSAEKLKQCGRPISMILAGGRVCTASGIFCERGLLELHAAVREATGASVPLVVVVGTNKFLRDEDIEEEYFRLDRKGERFGPELMPYHEFVPLSKVSCLIC